MDKAIRILLVNEAQVIREGLRGMLEPKEDMEVVGDFASAEEAFSKIARLHPDVVLMDAQMRGMNGIEATRSLKRDELDYGIDVIILAESANCRAEALKAGAVSYLLKDITRVELVQAIRQVYQNRRSSKERDDPVEEAVELLVPPSVNTAQLLRFMCQLKEKLDDNYAGIMSMVGSWDQGTVITIRLQPARFSGFVDKLGNMPEVEKVEEEPLARGAFSRSLEKFWGLPKLSISLSKRIRVTLEETG